jgi:hypothetical protein
VDSVRPHLAQATPLAAETSEVSVNSTRSAWPYFYAALVFGVLYGLAISLRYTSAWSEGDTSYFARAITSLMQYGSLSADINRLSYPQGFAYQVWAASLAFLTNTSVYKFIDLTSPILGSGFLALFGFVLFRRLLNSSRLGLLATITLFLIPELVFVVTRGNHEKLTVSFTLLITLAFLKSFQEMTNPNRKAVFVSWVLCYYFIIFTAAATNVYFGSTFVIAITFMLSAFRVLSRIFPKFKNVVAPLTPRLARIVATSWLIVFFDLFYLYPPSSDFLLVFKDAAQHLGNLFTPQATQSIPYANPYAKIGEVWSNPGYYRIVSLFRWTLFGGSFVSWIALAVMALRQAKISLNGLMVLSLYAAFTFILALAVPIDFLGLGVGSNLQVRLYTYTSLFSVPPFVLGLVLLSRWAKSRVSRFLLTGAISLGFVFFALMSFLKLTQDPAISNVWRFFETQEADAISFYLNHQLDRTRQLWIGSDDRLRHGYYVTYPSEALSLLYNSVTGEYNVAAVPLNSKNPSATTDYTLDSPLIRANSLTWQAVPLPRAILGSQLYDNGNTSIRYTNPNTPFLR